MAVAGRVMSIVLGSAAIAGGADSIPPEICDRLMEAVEKDGDGGAVEAGEASLLSDVGVESGERSGSEVGPLGGVKGGVLDASQPVEDLLAD